MKKLLVCIMTVSALLTFNPTQSLAGTKATPTSMPISNASDVAKINMMVTRLHEIDAMDKSNLSASEKKSLRKEVRGIKREIQRADGVFVSVGALLLIIILLIILL